MDVTCCRCRTKDTCPGNTGVIGMRTEVGSNIPLTVRGPNGQVYSNRPKPLSPVSQSLLVNAAHEENVDVPLVRKQYKYEGISWNRDRNGRVAVVNVGGVDFDCIGPVDLGFRWVNSEDKKDLLLRANDTNQ